MVEQFLHNMGPTISVANRQRWKQMKAFVTVIYIKRLRHIFSSVANVWTAMFNTTEPRKRTNDDKSVKLFMFQVSISAAKKKRKKTLPPTCTMQPAQ